MTDIASIAPLSIERGSSAIATLWLDAPHQPVVVLDSIMLDRLDDALTTLEADPPSCLHLRSRDTRVWVAGADLKEINALDDDAMLAYMARGQQVMRRLASLPCPVIALIDGATLGGGLELAMHCNGIVIASRGGRDKPYPVGLPETSLGLLPAWGGTQLLPARIGVETGLRAIASGTPFSSDALPEGLADVVVATTDELERAAVSIQGDLSQSVSDVSSCDAHEVATAASNIIEDTTSSNAARRAVQCTLVGSTDGLAAGQASEREGIVSLRDSSETRALLDAFLNKNG